MHALGIDIGGTGIKGAPVDLETGQLLADRKKIATPQPATPEAVTEVVKELAESFGWSGVTGATFPGVVIEGVVRSAANVDKSWIGSNAAASRSIHVLSTFAAVRTVPPATTPGKVAPMTPDQLNASTSSCTTSVTASGVAGDGVAIFFRSASSFPVARSTGAPLIPVPPMSIPSACMFILPTKDAHGPPGFSLSLP